MNFNRLPAFNLTQKLFYSELPQCNNDSKTPEPVCCDHRLEQWYSEVPNNFWDSINLISTKDKCVEEAFLKQCMLSQHYNYLSGNNSLPKGK